ncbi:hypothetical protein ACHAWF_014582 [Thalassiosira exigua]
MPAIGVGVAQGGMPNGFEVVRAESLMLDCNKVDDVLSLLRYGSNYMKSLKHFHAEIYPAGCNVTADALRHFLKLNRGKLQTFYWSAPRCRFNGVRELTNDGQMWLELHDLQVLWISAPIFSRSTDLLQVLNQQPNIVSLSLSHLAMGREHNIWSLNDRKSLATCIGQCEHLIQLTLQDHLLRDCDLEIMLPRLANLRTLDLTGRVDKSYLSDKACKLISRYCPRLQYISLLHQRKVTISGLNRVIKSFPNLKMLEVSVQVKPKGLKELLLMAKQLRCLQTEARYDKAEYIDIVEATGGRIFLLDGGDELAGTDEAFFDIWGGRPALSGECVLKLTNKVQREYLHSKKICLDILCQFDNPKVVNAWEPQKLEFSNVVPVPK